MHIAWLGDTFFSQEITNLRNSVFHTLDLWEENTRGETDTTGTKPTPKWNRKARSETDPFEEDTEIDRNKPFNPIYALIDFLI